MLLLDTCVLIWLDSDPAKISHTAADAVRASAGNLFASSISALEIATKVRKGKLALSMPVEQWFPSVLHAHGITEIAADSRICALSASLPPLHNDPFDRIIIATAHSRGLRTVTSDALIHAYPQADHIW
jgi:PIN domain nuclease of toxin-antitoxin system